MKSAETQPCPASCEASRPGPPRRLAPRERWMLWLIFLLPLGLHAGGLVYHGGSLRGADGQWYYATLRSMVFDLDFDFSNELRLTPHPEILYPKIAAMTGRYVHPYPIGWALTAFVPYLLVHAAMSALASIGAIGPVTGYELPYQLAASLSHAAAGSGALALMYAIARRYFAAGPSAAAVLLILCGSPMSLGCSSTPP